MFESVGPWTKGEAKLAAATAINKLEHLLVASATTEVLHHHLESMRVRSLLNNDYAAVAGQSSAFTQYTESVDLRLEHEKLERDVQEAARLRQERHARMTRQSPAEAVAAARRDVAGYMASKVADERQSLAERIGAHAQANPSYRRELEQHREVAAAAKQALTIGTPLPKSEWARARDLAGANGRVFLPKVHTDYSGVVVQVTDTHIVQKTGRRSVVAHDAAKLENRAELERLHTDDQLVQRRVTIAYGPVSGRSRVHHPELQQTVELRLIAREYAAKNIASIQGRSAFLSNVDRMLVAAQHRTRPDMPARSGPAAQLVPSLER